MYFISFVWLFLYFYLWFSERSVSILVTQLWFVTGLLNLPDMTKGSGFCRRTRYVFDVALKVHQNIQQRDIEVGRNLGNRILRYLDRMKPSAHIRGEPPGKLPTSNNVNKQMLKPGEVPGTARPNSKMVDRESNGRHLFSLPMNIRPKYFPTLGIMMRPSKPASMIGHRHFYSTAVIPDSNYRIGRFEGVFRKDIMQWMLQNWRGLVSALHVLG